MEVKESLIPIINSYFEKDPVGAAHSLEVMSPEDALTVLSALPEGLANEAFRHLPANNAAQLISEMEDELFSQIVSKLDPHQGAGIFRQLEEDLRFKFLNFMSEKMRAEIKDLLTYPEDSAGHIMTTSFFALEESMTVKEAITHIRKMAARKETSFYAYVVNLEKQLVGIMNMRDLMLAQDRDSISKVMRTDVFSVNAFMDREQVAEEMSGRKYFSVPVVDAENRMLGVIRAESLIQDVQEEATEDFQKMFGAGGDERAFSSITYSLKRRLPWLHVNLLTAFLAAGVVALFQDIIAQLTILAVFLPIVAGQGGNAGAQSLAVVMRGLVMREIPMHRAKKLILKEAFIGLVTGAVIGLVTALIAGFWGGNPYLGVVIGLAMVVNLTFAGFSGAAIPILMKSFGMDPAQCSNIILTTITDVMGFFAFLGFAVLFQGYLLS